MASTIDPRTSDQSTAPGPLTVLVDVDELDEALLDPRVRRVNREAAEFLDQLERHGRNL
jgi:hypothetical protein